MIVDPEMNSAGILKQKLSAPSTFYSVQTITERHENWPNSKTAPNQILKCRDCELCKLEAEHDCSKWAKLVQTTNWTLARNYIDFQQETHFS